MITDDDVDAMVAVCGEWCSWRGGMRAAAEEIERRVLARASKPMHEPVTKEEARRAWEILRNVGRGLVSEAMRSALTDFLANRLKYEKPVDPRVELVRKLAEQEMDMNISTDVVPKLLAKLDEVKS
jgi:hypothetical protein